VRGTAKCLRIRSCRYGRSEGAAGLSSCVNPLAEEGSGRAGVKTGGRLLPATCVRALLSQPATPRLEGTRFSARTHDRAGNRRHGKVQCCVDRSARNRVGDREVVAVARNLEVELLL